MPRIFDVDDMNQILQMRLFSLPKCLTPILRNDTILWVDVLGKRGIRIMGR